MSVTMDLGKVGMLYKGAHDSTKTYEKNDIVISSGSGYVAIQDVPVGAEISNATYWGTLVLGADPEFFATKNYTAATYATKTEVEDLQAAVGSPLVANAVADMTDTEKVYVYTGSETGYTSGNWYYYNGSAWVSGGTYNSQGIGDGTITTAKIADGAVTDAKLAEDGVLSKVSYALEEVQEFADKGLKRLKGFWKRGNIYQHAFVPTVKYRAVSELQYTDVKITLSIKSGYQFFYVVSDAGGTYGNTSPMNANDKNVAANSYFYVVVARSPQDTSETIDPNVFGSQIVFNTEIYNKLLSITSVPEIVELNRPQEQMVYNLGKGRSSRFNDEYAPLEFIHFSDIHASAPLWKRLCEYMDKYSSQIPFALHTGDYVKASQLQYTDLYALQTPTAGYILNCVGNHDSYATNDGTVKASASDTYAKLFNHISDWGVTFGSATNAMYYYKDFADSGVRLIVLDQYYWDATQESWLETLLDDAITNNLAVITASHVCSGALPFNKRIDCSFTTQEHWTSTEGGTTESTANLIPAIETKIQAFKTGGGIHVCHLCGHWHHDVMGKTDNGVLNISIECATNDGAYFIDSERVEGTRSFDCFNVIAVDRSLNTIRLVRIGNDVDYNGSKKDVLCYNYDTDEVVVNY